MIIYYQKIIQTDLYNRILKPVNVHVPKIYDPNEQNSKDNISRLINNNINEWYNNNDSDIIKASLYKPLDTQEVNYIYIYIYIKNTNHQTNKNKNFFKK